MRWFCFVAVSGWGWGSKRGVGGVREGVAGDGGVGEEAEGVVEQGRRSAGVGGVREVSVGVGQNQGRGLGGKRVVGEEREWEFFFSLYCYVIVNGLFNGLAGDRVRSFFC